MSEKSGFNERLPASPLPLLMMVSEIVPIDFCVRLLRWGGGKKRPKLSTVQAQLLLLSGQGGRVGWLCGQRLSSGAAPQLFALWPDWLRPSMRCVLPCARLSVHLRFAFHVARARRAHKIVSIYTQWQKLHFVSPTQPGNQLRSTVSPLLRDPLGHTPCNTLEVHFDMGLRVCVCTFRAERV